MEPEHGGKKETLKEAFSSRFSGKDPNFDRQAGHYLPRTMRTAGRDPIPLRQSFSNQWHIDCQDQAAPIWGLVSPSQIPYGLVSALMQGAIRQGRILESLCLVLEAARTDAHWEDPPPGTKRKVGKAETNVFTRFFVISCEDIALANPYALVTMAQFCRNWKSIEQELQTQQQAELLLMKITIMLARSLKSRAVDWACICRIPLPTDTPRPFDLVFMFNQLCNQLIQGNHVMAVAYAESFISESLHDKKEKATDPLPKAIFQQLATGVMHRGSKVKHYTNKRQLVWLAFLKVLQHLSSQGQNFKVVLEIVESAYDLAHDDKFRWEIAARLFGRTAIMAICLRNEIEQRGLAPRNGPIEEMPLGRDFTDQELEALRLNLKSGNLWYGVSDVGKDKHTVEGKRLGRDIQHFVEIKAFLRHEDPTLIPLTDFYLKLCFQTRYTQEYGANGNFDVSGMPMDKYIEWLPELRKQHNFLNTVEDLMLKQTMTITFCECAENSVNMEQLGKMAPEGFTCQELQQIGQGFINFCPVEYYDLRQGLNGHLTQELIDRAGQPEEAGILILRGVGNELISVSDAQVAHDPELKRNIPPMDALMLDLLALDWDKKAFMKGRVCDKKARHNLCFADFAQEPDYENKKGRVIDFRTLPRLQSIRENLGKCFGSKATNLLAEGNHYYDAKECYIGRHGDAERRIVIGLRLGASMSLEFQWYQESNAIGAEMQFRLNHSDVYLFCGKSVGTDWKKKIIFTLRHSANGKKAK